MWCVYSVPQLGPMGVLSPWVVDEGVTTTGVLVEGGVPIGERSEPTFLFRRAAGEENFGPKGHFP